jgi:hypothetical protein
MALLGSVVGFLCESVNPISPEPQVSIKNSFLSQVPVAHACNPSFLGGSDQKDHSSKPAPGKRFVRPYLKISNTKKDWQSGSNNRAPKKSHFSLRLMCASLTLVVTTTAERCPDLLTCLTLLNCRFSE